MRVDKQLFAEKLKQLRGIIPTGGALEVLRGVLVADGKITANNLDYCMQVPLGIPDTGECFFLPQRAIDLVLKLPDGLIDIMVGDDYSVEIKAGKIHNRLSGLDPATFPKMPEIPKQDEPWIDADDLMAAIRTVSYATDKTNTRPCMAAVFLSAKNGTLNVVATDSHRLDWMKMDCAGNFELVVPAAAALTMIKSGLTGKMFIRSNGKSAVFETPECSFFTRLVDQVYPNYPAIFPKEEGMKIKFRKYELIQALERATITANEQVIRMTLAENELAIESKSQYGRYHERVALANKTDETLVTNFNSKYALEALKAHPEEMIEGALYGTLSPIIFENDRQKTLFLPVRA